MSRDFWEGAIVALVLVILPMDPLVFSLVATVCRVAWLRVG